VCTGARSYLAALPLGPDEKEREGGGAGAGGVHVVSLSSSRSNLSTSNGTSGVSLLPACRLLPLSAGLAAAAVSTPCGLESMDTG